MYTEWFANNANPRDLSFNYNTYLPNEFIQIMIFGIFNKYTYLLLMTLFSDIVRFRMPFKDRGGTNFFFSLENRLI